MLTIISHQNLTEPLKQSTGTRFKVPPQTLILLENV